MEHLFEGNSANEVWKMASSKLRDGKNFRTQTGRGGKTREIDQAFFTIKDPSQRWVVTRQPPLNPAFAIAEVVWILNGRKDSAFLNFWNSQLPKYAGTADEYHGAYGFRLRQHFGIDQLERAYLALKHNVDSRQIVLQIWDSKIDFPDKNGRPVNQDIPCNVMALLKVRDGKLNWTQIVRSNDLFLGVPYNFIQFTTIHEVLAGWLNIDLGLYNHMSDSLHIYESWFDYMEIDVFVNAELNTDSLHFPKKISEKVFSKLSLCMDAMQAPNLTHKELPQMVERCNVPGSFKNLLYIVAAETARRKGWFGITQDIMANCSNPILKQVWERWFLHCELQIDHKKEPRL